MPSDAPATRPARVLVADDHAVVRAGIVALLHGAGDLVVVHEAADGHDAVQAWPRVRPDLGLIDLSMPGLDGFATVAAIRAIDPAARLVVLTTLGGEEDVYQALKAGAAGYLLKDCPVPELLQALRTVLRGGRHLQHSAAERLAERLTQPVLTTRQHEVLQALASGLGNKHIARSLAMAEGTVKTHVKAVLHKLGAHSRTQAVASALERGLLRTPAA